MASQRILNGPELSVPIPSISLGRYLYQRLVNHGNRVAMVGATLLVLLIKLGISIYIP
jgi:hypothetical protein